jgi:hypothetical protein
MTKRILRELRLDKIAAVDKPCQEHATMTIMKRDESDDLYWKRDFSDKEREKLAESGAAMSDGGFPIVTTADLKNAVRAIGRANNPEAAKKHIIRRARALDAVDMLPEDWEVKKMAEAVETIAKAWIDPADGAKPFSDFLEASMESTRYWEAMEAAGPIICALDNSLRSIAGDGTLDVEARQNAMRESVEAFMAQIRETMPEIQEEIAEALTDLGKRSNAGNHAGDHVSKKEKSMSDELKKVADLEKKVADLTKSLAEAQTIAKLSADERDHMDTLDEKGKKDFLALSPEERKAKVKKAAESDEVLKVDGAEIRKSAVGEATFTVLKSQQAAIAKQAEDLKKAQDAAHFAELKKRASDEFSHLPGTVESKATILKAISTLDEEVRKGVEQVFSTAEKLMSNAFVMKGVNDGSTAAEGTPEATLNKRAKEIQKAENTTFEKAYAKAMEENPALYEQISTPVASAQ